VVSTSTDRRTFLAMVPFLLAGCATGGGSDRYREGDNKGQETSLSFEDEKMMTRQYLPKMKKEYPPHQNKDVQRFIEKVGNKIVSSNALHQNPYTYSFTVVDVKNVNAFALPAGTVFVTAPLMKMAQSEAELAGVVGHEIGHIQARHTAERIHKEKEEKTKSILFGIGGAILGGAAGYGLSQFLCKKGDKECVQRISLYAAAAGAGGGLLIQKFAFMANSREDEMEADRIGFKTSLKSGYHKDHVGLFYSRLLEMEKEYQKNKNPILAPLTDAMSTHPPSKERVKQMNEMAAQAVNTGTTVDTSDFKRIRGLL
ncbi:MAG: M48 family metalloprotease, partial [Nitrospinota bacterium]